MISGWLEPVPASSTRSAAVAGAASEPAAPCKMSDACPTASAYGTAGGSADAVTCTTRTRKVAGISATRRLAVNAALGRSRRRRQPVGHLKKIERFAADPEGEGDQH